ncbi:MAG TPA: DUF1566 domain-containing protein [Candidatus Avirikenella pullistercoris]|nr:DUF1566 domain-containing protein [Candidatus Avirikenella pullistercoris]
MKKYLLLMFSAAIIFTGCSKDEGGEGNGNGNGTSPGNITFVPPAQEQLSQNAYADNENTGSGFTFTADDSWSATVTEIQSPAATSYTSMQPKSVTRTGTDENNYVVWLKLYNGDKETYGGDAGTVTIRIEMDQNYTGEKREASITIVSGDNTFTVTVVQEGTKQDGSVNEAPVPAEEIILDRKTLPIVVGETTVLTATVLPENATIKSVTWSSSNPQIATVHPVTGAVTAIVSGNATITATSSSDKTVTATCSIVTGTEYEPEPTQNIIVALEHGINIINGILTTEQITHLTTTNTTSVGNTFNENSPYNKVSPKFAVAAADASPENTGIAYNDAERKEYNWENAYNACKSYTDKPGTVSSGKWRVPTVKELQIIYSTMANIFETVGEFANGDKYKGTYWSAVEMAGFETGAWSVWMENGEAGDGIKEENRRVRCVRDLDYDMPEPEPAPTQNIIVASDEGINISEQLTSEQLIYLNNTDITKELIFMDSPYDKISPKFAVATANASPENSGIAYDNPATKSYTWVNAYKACKGYNQAGTGAAGTWRLPTLAELATICKFRKGDPNFADFPWENTYSPEKIPYSCIVHSDERTDLPMGWSFYDGQHTEIAQPYATSTARCVRDL